MVNLPSLLRCSPILAALFRSDPAERLAVADLEHHEWLMGDAVIEAANGEPEQREPWVDDEEEVAAYWAKQRAGGF
jgi:hypothetical protein